MCKKFHLLQIVVLFFQEICRDMQERITYGSPLKRQKFITINLAVWEHSFQLMECIHEGLGLFWDRLVSSSEKSIKARK